MAVCFRSSHADPTTSGPLNPHCYFCWRVRPEVTRRPFPCYPRCVPNRSRGSPVKKLTALPLFAALSVCVFAQQNTAPHFDGDSWWSHVKFLADDTLEGRDTGSDGLRKAQAYAVEQFKKAGLEP